MTALGYAAPATLSDALRLLAADEHARVYAGGTDLLVQVRSGRPAPARYVDLKRIPELIRIESHEDSVVIGAAVPAVEIAAHPTVRNSWPGVAESVALIGSTQIQGRASLGGNLCNGSPAADTTPALIVSGARCHLAGRNGERVVDVVEFVRGPGETCLDQGELLVAIELPRSQAIGADAYLRLTPRTEMDIAIAGAAARIELDAAGHCSRARIAIGAVAPTARRVLAAEEALHSGPLTEERIQAAAAAAEAATQPIDDKRGTRAYRRSMAGVLVKRAIAIASERAGRRS